MRSKFTQKPEPREIVQDDFDEAEKIEVENEGPAISSIKKNKMTIIVASAVLITLVCYFFFFKGNDTQVQEEEEVKAPVVLDTEIARGSGKSPFAIDKDLQDSTKVELLEKPSTPELPALPDLPKNLSPADAKALQDQGTDLEEKPVPIDQAGVLLQPVSPPPAADPASPQPPVTTQQPSPPVVAQPTPVEEKPKDPRYTPIIVFAGNTANMPSRSVGYDNNVVVLSQDPINKLQDSAVPVQATKVADRAHTVTQGKLLVAVLETAIDTQLPGFVRAIISRDVYADSGNDVLIPKGSRLFGSYSSQISRGQGRVSITWTRLIRSDGIDLNVSMVASDQFGRSGIAGDVDNRYGSIVANSILTSVLAIGTAVAADRLLNQRGQVSTTNNTQLGTVTTTGNATTQASYDVSKTIIDTVGQVISNNLNMNPVIRVPQGTKITVIVNADMNMPSVRKVYTKNN